jgi:GT2 family glycosyltransferase
MIGDNPLKPQVSVIIASYNSRETIEACLASLRDQETDIRFEVIVVDSSTDNTGGVVRENFPKVILYSFGERKFAGDARNFGISKSKGYIIAFIDADCIVDKDWVNQIIEAHKSPYLVIGGVIDNLSSDSLTGWAYYFCEFNLWLPHMETREISEIAGCCLSMKREAFEKYGPFIEGTYCSDTAFHWKLQKDGHKVLSVPSVRVYHSVTHGFFSFLQHIVEHRVFFARVSVSEQDMALMKRILLAFLSPLMPFILFVVVFGRVFRSRAYLDKFFFAAPAVFLGLTARSYGEFIGYMKKAQP